MKIVYITQDVEHGLAYIGLGSENRSAIVAKTTSPHPNVNFDFDEDGNLVGIEIY